MPFVGGGAPCGGAAVCGFGYYCDPMRGICAANPDLGEPCILSREGTTAELQCVRGWCDRDGTKACIERKADGEPCTSMYECAGFCDPATQQCAGGSWSVPVCDVP